VNMKWVCVCYFAKIVFVRKCSFILPAFFVDENITECLNYSGASLVKGIPFNPNDPEVSGPDIFRKLVPLEAHKASSLYR